MGINGHPETLTFSGAGGQDARRCKLPRRLHRGRRASRSRESRLEDAELVFVGYGIVGARVPVGRLQGRWTSRARSLLIMNNDPEDDPKLFAGKTRLWYGRWDYKYEQAAKVGAAGAIIIHTTPSARATRGRWCRRRGRASSSSCPPRGEPARCR